MDATNAEEREEGEIPFYEKEFCNADGTMTMELHRAADCSDGAGDLNDAMREMLDAEWQKEMGSVHLMTSPILVSILHCALLQV